MSHRSGWLVLRPELVDFSVDTRLNLKKYGQLETSTNAHWSLVRLIKHIFLCPQKPQGSFPTWWIKIIRLRCLRNFLDLFEAQHLLVAAISHKYSSFVWEYDVLNDAQFPPLSPLWNCMFPAQKAQTVALLWLCFNDGCTCLANKKVFSWGGYASSALYWVSLCNTYTIV